MSRRAGGQAIADARIIREHPELEPELSRELAALAVLERAWEVARDRSVAGVVGRPAESGAPVSPDAFEGYTLSGVVHRGGQGVVYEGVQISTGRRVAIKVMREGLFAGDGDGARFEREVRILGQIEDPGVVSILGSGVHAGHFFYVMELVSGLPLDRFAGERCPTVREKLEVFVKTCEAVSAAHLRGIIHRDLKPANIIVDAHGQPRILDFGLARVAQEWGASRARTLAGQFVGSMPWASPEQAAGDLRKIDQRTDVYSLGVMLYGALTGRFPYRVEGGPRDVLDQILTAPPVRPRSVSRLVDDDLEAVVLKCLAKERERRYQSAAELADDLRRYLDRRPVHARAPSTAYQLRVFVRRNRALVVGASAVMATLLLGLLGTSVGFLEASAGRRAAESSRDTARAAENIANGRLEESQRQTYVASIVAADSAVRAMDAEAAAARLDAAPASLRDWEWQYLAGQVDLSVARFKTPPVLHSATSPDGTSVAALCGDGQLRLLDARTGAERWRAALPAEAAGAEEQTVASFSRDGAMVVTAHGNTVLVWKIGEERPLASVAFPALMWGWINAMVTDDGKRLIANGRVNRMSVWELPSGALVRDLPSDTAYSGLDLLPGDRWGLLACGRGVAVFDTRTGEIVREIPAPPLYQGGTAGMLRVSPDGSLAALAVQGGIAMIDLRRGIVDRVLSGHTQQVVSLAFSGDGRRLASTGWDRTVRVWDVATGVQERVFWGHAEVPSGIGFILSDSRIASSGRGGQIHIWDPARSPGPRVVDAGSIVFGLAFLPSGTLILTTFKALQAIEPTPRGGTGPIAAVSRTLSGEFGAVSPDRTLRAECRDGSALVVSDVATGGDLWAQHDQGGASHFHTLTFSPDSTLLAASNDDGTACLWEARTGTRRAVLERNPGEPFAPRFSPDNHLVAIPTGPEVRLWETGSGRLVAKLADPNRTGVLYQCVTFSPDGRFIAAGDSDGAATLWDAATQRQLRSLRGMKPAVWSLAFSPSGTRLATGSQDRMVRVWNPETGDELLVLRGHTGTVMSLAWSPDGVTLASGSYDGTVRLWTAPGVLADARASAGARPAAEDLPSLAVRVR